MFESGSRPGQGLRRGALGCVLLAGVAAISGVAHGQEVQAINRVALVIGNGGYDTLEALPNPPNDAAAVAEALWNAGFEVIELIDADREQMVNGITAFANRLTPGAEAVFYYAGHGVAVDGVNYLIPVATPVESEAQLSAVGITAQMVLQTMELSGSAFNVVVLDACRNNPFRDAGPAFVDDGSSRALDATGDGLGGPLTRGAPGGGLAEMAVGGQAQTLIAYATAPGQVALDGDSVHSPYTHALIDYLSEPGLEIGMLFRRVRGQVRESTEGYQIPWTTSTLEREFYFRPEVDTLDATTGMRVATNTLGMLPPRQALDRSFWYSITGRHDVSALQTYLEEFPEGDYGLAARYEIAALAGGAATPPPAPSAPARARSNDPAAGPDEATPELTTSAPLGVGPVPIELPPLTERHGERIWVQIEDLPRHGRVQLAGGKVLAAKDVVDGAAFMGAAFEPTIGTHGAAERLRFSVLDQNGQSHPYTVGVESWVHACDLFAGMPEDSRRVTAGTRQFILDMRYQQAIEVCELAVKEYPGIGRFASELARAYRSAGRYDDAVRLNQQAIDLGHNRALVVLGLMNWAGQGVPKDLTRAMSLFKLAWERDESAAGTAIAAMYREGAGVPADDAEAMRWYQEAAQRGNDWAMYNLGEMHEHGRSVEADIQEAIRWYTRAARSGELTAQYRLAKIYERGEGVPANQGEAERWYRTAAGQGVPNAMTRLGVMAETGAVQSPDYLAALQLYRQAAQLGDREALHRLGRLYRDGKGIAKDEVGARRLFEAALEEGHGDARRDLAQLYEEGRGGAKDELKALSLYQEAAELDPWAARAVGRLYTQSEQIPADYAEAAAWYRKAALGGVGWASRDLARLYEQGQGVAPEPAEAVRWYALALAQGGEDAKLRELVQQRLAGLPEPARIAGLQLLLKDSGYEVGTIDGQLGPQTRAALRSFGAAVGLEGEPSEITPDLLARLAGHWQTRG
jgi:TPR repeat protein